MNILRVQVGKHAEVTFGTDNGYTAICVSCEARHAPEKELIGKPRTLRMIPCVKCLRDPEHARKTHFRIHGHWSLST